MHGRLNSRLNRAVKHILAFLTFVLGLVTTLQAEQRLFGRWAVELIHPTVALERYQTYRVGGLERDGNFFYMASPYGDLEKRSLTTGTKIWGIKLDAISQSGWAIDGKEIFGGDTNGNIYAIDLEKGEIKWKASTKGVFFAKPIVSESTVWVMNSLGTLQAYNRNDGSWVWQQTDPSISSASLWSAQGFSKLGNTIIAGFPSALLQAIDATTGQVLWKESFSVLPSGTDTVNDIKAISLSEDVLFASSFAGNMKAWSLKGGQRKILWEKQISLYSPASLDKDGTLYFSGKDGTLRACDAKTGFEKWKVELPSGLGTQASLGDDTVWIGTSRGQVIVYSKEGKKLAETNDYESAIWNAPLLVDGNEAIVLTTQGILRRLRLASL